MSTDPTPAPASPPAPTPAAPEPIRDPFLAKLDRIVVDAIRTQRENVGYLLTIIAVVFLVGGVMLAVKSNSVPESTSKTANPDGTGVDDLLKGLPSDTADGTQMNRFDFLVVAFGCASVLVATGTGAAYLLVGLRKPTEAQQRREARIFVLAVGTEIGAALIVTGAWLFIRWSDSLVRWLDKGEMKEAKFTLYPLLAMLVGGLLILAAVQPARAEERNNPAVRRAVYGSNFGLTMLVLFVLLVIVNAVVAMRLPNKLDTTTTRIHTLNEQTVKFLEQSEQPIRAFALVSDGRSFASDIRQLLILARDANPGKFQVRFLSPSLDAKEIAKLRDKYPKAVMTGTEGVLLVVGDNDADADRHTYIRFNEFIEEKPGPDRRTVEVFNGEARLLRELMFLSESKKKPKVYFTQSSGELSVSGGGDDPKRGATALVAHLKKNNYDVEPLTFVLGAKAEVPADAAVVVVADPTDPIPPAGVEAISKYMAEAKGKLVVLAGAQAGADRKPLKLGLEPLLGTFGIQLGQRFLYSIPPTEAADPRMLRTIVVPDAVEAGNPVALSAFAHMDRSQLRDCREIQRAQGAGTSVFLLATQPGQQLWALEERAANPREKWDEIGGRLVAINKADRARDEKQATALREALFREVQIFPPDRLRPLAVLVSERQRDKDNKEKEIARVAVFGCGWFASDEASRSAIGSPGRDMMGSTIDWVRDRPAVALPDKVPNPPYVLKAGYTEQRLVYVPGLLVMLAVVGLGAGVWVIRRK